MPAPLSTKNISGFHADFPLASFVFHIYPPEQSGIALGCHKSKWVPSSFPLSLRQMPHFVGNRSGTWLRSAKAFWRRRLLLLLFQHVLPKGQKKYIMFRVVQAYLCVSQLERFVCPLGNAKGSKECLLFLKPRSKVSLFMGCWVWQHTCLSRVCNQFSS